MFEHKIRINNKTGLHARPASELVELANKFESDVLLLVDDEEVDAKSIIDVLSSGIDCGTEVVLQIEGSDEAEAGKKVSDYLLNLID